MPPLAWSLGPTSRIQYWRDRVVLSWGPRECFILSVRLVWWQFRIFHPFPRIRRYQGGPFALTVFDCRCLDCRLSEI